MKIIKSVLLSVVSLCLFAGVSAYAATGTMTPATFDYGSVTVGSVSTQVFTLTPAGGALTITSATVSAAPFTKVADTCTGAAITFPTTCTVTVQYSPTAVTTSTGTLTLVTNATDGTQKISSLLGTGTTGPSVTATISPTSYSYGNVTIGSSTSTSFTITNTGGTANLTIASATVSAAPFVKTADNCTGASLALNATCTVEVSYLPTALTTSNATLSVVTNATNGTTKISTLNGSGIAGPSVTGSMTPASYNFGNVTIGSASTSTFTVTNTGGSVNLNITSATASGAPFTKTADTCTGASLALNATCTVEVTYFPTAATTSLGTLSVVTNATDGTTKISSLIGTGVTGPSVTGSMTPTTNNYGNVTIGTASTATFTVENTGGTINLNITSATVSAAPFVKTADTCTGATLPLNATCTIEVTYFPSASAVSFATLTVVTNATDGTSKISSLIGTGIAGPTVTATISPGTYDFGSVTVGTLSTTSFTIENTGGSANLNITSATVAAAPFSKTADNCTGASLALNETCTVTVSYFPTTATASASILTVVTNATNGTSKIVSLTGTGTTGTSATASITPASHDFGETDIGTSVSTTFTIENTGGSGNLFVTSSAVTASTPFTISSDDCAGRWLTLNQTCNIGITFLPTTAGHYSATLTAVTNATNGANKIVSFTGFTSAPGTVGFSAVKYIFKNDAGKAVLYVTRTGGSSGTTVLDYTTERGTASHAAGDYTDTTGTLTWLDGDSAPKKIEISVVRHSYGTNASRTFSVILSANSGDATLINNIATVQLYDATSTRTTSLSNTNNGAPTAEDNGGCVISSNSGGSNHLWIFLMSVIMLLAVKRRRIGQK